MGKVPGLSPNSLSFARRNVARTDSGSLSRAGDFDRQGRGMAVGVVF